MHPAQPDHSRDPRITVRRLVLDLGRLRADVGQGPVALTSLEFLLLKRLAENSGRSVSRSQLLIDVWGMRFDPATNVVDTCVYRLRSKLDYDLIKTIRGTGYQLVP
jgi:DNA-binding response OmpR family regulator